MTGGYFYATTCERGDIVCLGVYGILLHFHVKLTIHGLRRIVFEPPTEIFVQKKRLNKVIPSIHV
jgi:hypothetical protein